VSVRVDVIPMSPAALFAVAGHRRQTTFIYSDEIKRHTSRDLHQVRAFSRTSSNACIGKIMILYIFLNNVSGCHSNCSLPRIMDETRNACAAESEYHVTAAINLDAN
jgi:hypothetical protein